MFKFNTIFLVYIFFQTCVCDESVSLDSNQTLSELNSTLAPQSNQPFINTDLTNHNLTMFAKKENNLVVNSSGSVVGITRSGHSAATSSSTLILILISLVVVSCIIAIVVTALFVMRRRFTIWRLNGSKSNECSDGANGVLTNASSENGSVNKCEGVVEAKTETVDETKTEVDNEETVEQKVEQVKTETQNLPEQTSATSLIVNVLNELSESVACKLANTPSKSTNNLINQDPEKQPLNTEQEDK